jgi:glycosyltransferase involved in cell wall biosynthesis
MARQPSVDPDQRPRVLVVSPFSIHPIIHGAAVRISNLTRRLAESYRVSLLVLGEGTDDPGHREAYGPFCEQVLFHRLPRATDPTCDPFHLLPPAATSFTHRAVTDRISALVDAHQISIVQLEFAELGGHVRRNDGAATALVEHDIGFTTQRRQRALGIGDRFDAGGRIGAGSLDGIRQERFEINACAMADQVHCMSEDDRATMARRLGAADHLRVVPNGVDTRVFAPGPTTARHGALFLGSFPHLPNLDAFEHLMDTIWPEIRLRSPDATLTVAGARPPESVLARHRPAGVRVVGEVDEVAPLYRDHRVLIVPLRAGSGTRLKILEAMASGLPVVSTTIGAEGLTLADPPEVVLADDVDEIAEAVAGLLAADNDEIEARGARGRNLVETHYDWDAVAEDLRRGYADLLTSPSAEPALRVTSVDAPTSGGDPAVTLVVPTSAGNGLARGLLDGLAAQLFDGDIEVVVVDHGSPEDTLDSWRTLGFRVVSVSGSKTNQGATLNAGARIARGRVLVFTTPNAIPASPTWVSDLVAPFDHDRPPAAVQGGITAQLIDGGPAHNPTFTRESERWRRAHGGLEFSLVNAAMPKTVWESFPFPPCDILADRHWQRIAADHELLILPCLAAAVRDVRQETPRNIVRTGIKEGRAWRDLGTRYTVTDCWADAFFGLPAIGGAGKPAPAKSRRHLAYRVLRPLGVYLGNRF